MCAQFIIKGNIKKAAISAGLPWSADFEDLNLDSTLIVPHQSAAPIALEDGLRQMHFSLVPSWSKERKPRFATHNARLFSEDKTKLIYDKPTWRGPFANHHCLVPISEFIEPIYEGPLGGNMVRFGQKNGEILWAAGLWDSWTDKSTGEVHESFTIITHDPPAFVAEMGHDRCPLFLRAEKCRQWLPAKNQTPREWVDWLLHNIADVSFETQIHRPLKMAAGKNK